MVIDNADLEDALTVVRIPPKPYWGRDGSRNGRGRGVLEVLTLGQPPADPGEFTGSERVAEILESLRGRADVVLIDTPAILSVGDAMTLAGIAEALIVVVRFQLMPRSEAEGIGACTGSLASNAARHRRDRCGIERSLSGRLVLPVSRVFDRAARDDSALTARSAAKGVAEG